VKRTVLICGGVGLLTPCVEMLFKSLDRWLFFLFPTAIGELFAVDAGFSKNAEIAWMALLVILNGILFALVGATLRWVLWDMWLGLRNSEYWPKSDG